MTFVVRTDVHVAALLRTRRRLLQPEDVGLPRTRRRRTPGLRREEVAALCSMSTAYYGRLERDRGPRPSPTILASLARALRFTTAERDQLFEAAGYAPPEGGLGATHVKPGVMHVLARLEDTVALVVDPVGEVVHQTWPAKAVFGELTDRTGWERSSYYRWFTDPGVRRCHPLGEHPLIGAEIADALRYDRQCHCGAARLTELLLDRSQEFRVHWHRGAPSATDTRAARRCRVVHPSAGVIDLHRDVLVAPGHGYRLVTYLATAGSESHTNLALAMAIGHHRFDG